jgi:hypothetical protein
MKRALDKYFIITTGFKMVKVTNREMDSKSVEKE